jgi:hypothetical protein
MNWMIIGTFKDKFKNDKNAFIKPLSSKGNLKWQPLKKGIKMDKIDLEEHFGKIDNCSAFVRVSIISPEKQEVDLKAFCDDRIVVMLNDQFIEHNNNQLKKV